MCETLGTGKSGGSICCGRDKAGRMFVFHGGKLPGFVQLSFKLLDPCLQLSYLFMKSANFTIFKMHILPHIAWRSFILKKNRFLEILFGSLGGNYH